VRVCEPNGELTAIGGHMTSYGGRSQGVQFWASAIAAMDGVHPVLARGLGGRESLDAHARQCALAVLEGEGVGRGRGYNSFRDA
jgi:hypothetical protein